MYAHAMNEPAATELPTTLQTGVFASNLALRPFWYAVARSIDVGPRPVPVVLLGERLVLWRGDGGALTAAPDRCPHREAPFSRGEVEEGCLVCPYHGWTFASGGRCVRVPSSDPGTPVPS